jgi:molybdate transport system ATP-binding protein
VSLSLHRPEGSALNAVTGTVSRISVVGNRARVALDSTPSIVAEVTEESLGHLRLGRGSPTIATWKATATRLAPRRGDGLPGGPSYPRAVPSK